MNVVVVDDEESLLNLTSEFLQLQGYQVKSFSDSALAQQWIVDNPDKVQAIITDEIMPGAVQGHNLVEQFSDSFPMMLMTGYIDSVELSKLNVPVIYKPFRMMAFIQAFEQALEKFR